MERNYKKKKHGKLIKCDNCKNKIDLEIAREEEYIERVGNKEILYCPICDNQIILK